MKTHQCESLESYIGLIVNLRQKAPNRELWYRGQARCEWGLLPGLWRHGIDSSHTPVESVYVSGRSATALFPSEKRLLDTFTETAESNGINCPSNYVHRLELAQHYGLPTNLLDWSSDPLVALFFAVSGAMDHLDREAEKFDEERCCSVWIVEPLTVNKEFFPPKGMDSSDDRDRQLLEKIIFTNDGATICFKGTKIGRRIVRQSGNFTYTSPRLITPLSYSNIYKKSLIRIDIPYSKVCSIAKTLKCLDLTEESLYFGNEKLDKVSRKVVNDVLSKFNDDAHRWCIQMTP